LNDWTIRYLKVSKALGNGGLECTMMDAGYISLGIQSSMANRTRYHPRSLAIMYETEVLRIIQHSRAVRDKEPSQERKRESGAKIEDDKVVQVKKRKTVRLRLNGRLSPSKLVERMK